MICQHFRPKWGDTYLDGSAGLSPEYKCRIRSLMYRLFEKAMLWELLIWQTMLSYCCRAKKQTVPGLLAGDL